VPFHILAQALNFVINLQTLISNVSAPLNLIPPYCFDLDGIMPILPCITILAQNVNESVLNWTQVCQLH
jgi:hypothetical protein